MFKKNDIFKKIDIFKKLICLKKTIYLYNIFFRVLKPKKIENNYKKIDISTF